MKFLIDNQLPPALAQFLRRRGFDCEHVLDIGLSQSSDVDLGRYAENHGRIIISKDEDFLYLNTQARIKIQLIWVRLGNCRTATLLAAFERLWPLVESSIKAGDSIIEIR